MTGPPLKSRPAIEKTDEPEPGAGAVGGQPPSARAASGTGSGPVGAIAGLLAGALLLARLVGYLREVVLADRLGASAETDAFYAAFLVPDILNYLVAGGALSVAFIPLFTRVRERQGREAAERLFGIVLGTLTILVAAAVLALFLAADEIVARLFPAFPAATRALTAELARILLPAQIFFVAGGVLRARLMADDHFLAHALAGLVYGLGTIAGGLVTSTPQGFAWGALAGAVVGHGVLPALDLWRRGALRLSFGPFSPDFRSYFWLALPLMIGVSLVTLDEWYDKLLGAALGAATIAHLGFARKLMQLPVALVGQALAVAVLPAMSRLRGDRREGEANALLERALQTALVLSVPGALFTAVFARPIVAVVYEHGAFGAADTAATAALLAAFALGIPAWTIQPIVVRAFYSREEMWRPMLLGTAVALASLPLYFALREQAGATGLALAGAIALTVNALATVAWSRQRFGGPSPSVLGVATLRGLGVALPAVGAPWLGLRLAPLDPSPLGELLTATAAFAAIALPTLLWIGDPGARALVARVRGRPRS